MRQTLPSRDAHPRRLASQRAGRALALAAALGLPVTATRVAAASEVRAVSRTVGEGYVVRVPGSDGLLTRRRLVQYLNLGVYELLPPTEAGERQRRPEEGQLQVVGSMRLSHDFGSYLGDARGSARQLLETSDRRQVDLLFGYLEGRNLGGWVDLRAGRQFEMSGLDWYVYDGGWVRTRTPVHLAFEGFGGFEVDGTAVFGYPTFELDGTSDTGADLARSAMVGGAVALSDLKWIDARLAYRRSFTPASINRDVLADDGSRGLDTAIDQELLSARFALRLIDGSLTPHGAARYNLGTGRLDDVAAGVDWQFTEMHTVRGMYLRTIPSFDLDSIFNSFSITPFEDARVYYEVRPTPNWTVSTRGQARIFRAQTTAELDSAPDRAVRVGLGGGVGSLYRRGRLLLRADGYGLGGEGGTQAGGSLDTRTFVYHRRIAVDGRAFFNYYADDLDPRREGWGLALQAGANFRLYRGIHLNILAEELFSTYTRQAFRGLAVLSADWTFRAGRR